MTDTTSAPTLDPCPWCGPNFTVMIDELAGSLLRRNFRVQCDSCDVFRIARSHEAAITGWNTRATQAPAQPDHTALLRQALEALELGRDALASDAHRYHEAMRGYRKTEHARVDAEVAQADAAIAAIRSALDSSTTGEQHG